VSERKKKKTRNLHMKGGLEDDIEGDAGGGVSPEEKAWSSDHLKKKAGSAKAFTRCEKHLHHEEGKQLFLLEMMQNEGGTAPRIRGRLGKEKRALERVWRTREEEKPVSFFFGG